MAQLKFNLLTDEELINKSYGEIYKMNDGSIEGKRFRFEKGGIYDYTIFGKEKICSCGRIRTVGVTCKYCGVPVLKKIDLYQRVGHIRLEVPVLYYHKEAAFFQALNNAGLRVYKSGKGSPTLYDLWNTEFKIRPPKDDEAPHGITKNGEKIVVESIEVNQSSDIFSVGTYGILNLTDINSMSGKPLIDVKKLINSVVLVPNPVVRPLSGPFMTNGVMRIRWPTMTSWYRAIIYFNGLFPNLLNDYAKTTPDKAGLCYYFNSLVSKVLMGTSPITQSSKESQVRNLFSVRVGSSGRTNIVSDFDLGIDIIKIPRSLAYQAIQTQILESLEKSGSLDAPREYLEGSPKAMEIFNTLITNGAALLVRNPTIHRYNVMGFKIELTDDIVIHIPHLIAKPYNADFDGDQEMFIIETREPYVTQILTDLSPRNLWYYEKNLKPIFVPTDEILYGLYLATLVQPKSKKLRSFESFSSLEQAYEKNSIEHDDLILFEERETTYGREKISNILGINLDSVLGPGVPIDANNISNIISMLYAKADRVERLKELQNFGSKVVTDIGLPSLSLKSLYGPVKDKRIQSILSSSDSEDLKAQKIHELFADIIQDHIKKLPDNNIETLIKSSGRIKMSQLKEIMSSSVIKTDKGLYVDSSSLVEGKTEAAYVTHAMENRKILAVKRESTPISGYNTRQLIISCMDYVYSKERKSQDSIGILLPRNKAEGRTLLNGTIVKASKADDLIRVKSFINSKVKKVYADEISTKFVTIKDGSYIGIAFAQGITESLTQSALRLKHGGMISSYRSFEVIADKKLSLKDISDGYLKLKSSNKVIRYPLGDFCTVNPKLLKNEVIFPGEVILSLSKKEMIDAKLAKVSSMLGFQASRLMHKSVGKSISYSPENGKIRYNLKLNKVTIGNYIFDYDPLELYYFADGDTVSVGQRISSGILDLNYLYEVTGSDNSRTFLCMYNAYCDIVENWDLPPELLEVVFRSIHASDFSIIKSINRKENKITRLYFGNTKKVISSAIKESESFEDTSAILNIVLGG